ncbi:hypothetical protein JCM10212_001976 [Sporobolomyces blumeae]
MATLDLSDPALRLSFSAARFRILQFSPSQAIPAKLVELVVAPRGAERGEAFSFVSITRTKDEVSVIVDEDVVSQLFPSTATSSSDSSASSLPLESSGPWTSLIVRGPMDLSLTGILHALTGPLRDARVPVFASSTWDTDYVLVNSDKVDVARDALTRAGWMFE